MKFSSNVVKIIHMGKEKKLWRNTWRTLQRKKEKRKARKKCKFRKFTGGLKSTTRGRNKTETWGGGKTVLNTVCEGKDERKGKEKKRKLSL